MGQEEMGVTIKDNVRDCDGNVGHLDCRVILQDVTTGGGGGGQRVPGTPFF